MKSNIAKHSVCHFFKETSKLIIKLQITTEEKHTEVNKPPTIDNHSEYHTDTSVTLKEQ